MNIGYAFWGHLGDVKYDAECRPTNAPDGNAFYSWAIIKKFQEIGDKVFHLMPNRDHVGYAVEGDDLFKAWAQEDRVKMYRELEVGVDIRKMDLILLEWRWEIDGRNDWFTVLNTPTCAQMDYSIQNSILTEAKHCGVPVVVFDLDYKLTEQDIRDYDIRYVIELGDKWELKGNPFIKSKRVMIPFDFSHMNDFDVAPLPGMATDSVIYIGNRYERDWAVEKYLPIGSVVYGNWTVGGRDSEEKWPEYEFRNQLQVRGMRDAYSRGVVTPLLAKRGYCEMGFMTARLLEAVFYGCVPLFIEEFGMYNRKYLPEHLDDLVVNNMSDVVRLSRHLKEDEKLRAEIIGQLRTHLQFMDVSYFVERVLDLAKEG